MLLRQKNPLNMLFIHILILFFLNHCECKIDIELTDNGMHVAFRNFFRNSEVSLEGIIGVGEDFTKAHCEENNTVCTLEDNSTLIIYSTGYGYNVVWEGGPEKKFTDKYSLDRNNTYWFGGPERYEQRPLEQQVLNGNDPYIIKKSDNFAVAERFWLSSKSTFIFIADEVPLFIDQNNIEDGSLFLIAKSENPYINRNRTILNYFVIMGSETKDLLQYALFSYLGFPILEPNLNMTKKPIWTTWPKYKQGVDQNKVKEFVDSIVSHNFSGGQIEIDEDWEVCFGSHVFNTKKFPDAKGMISSIKDQGFTTSIWINPFVNNNCQNYSNEGIDKGYFVKDPNGNTRAVWWESDDAHQVDFTNPEAAKWFSDKVKALTDDYGIDTFKFDAGETDYAIPPHQFDHIKDQEQVPNIFTKKYVETCKQFGDMIEVRSAWRTQHYPIMIRMIDKDSVWGLDDGLQSVITTLIQMNINGYSFVLPDMIGGNGYRAQPTSELLVRWTQANVFMPAIQFGFLPWDYPSDSYDVVELVRKSLDLREKYMDHILQALSDFTWVQKPANPPIWWADSNDLDAYAVYDEFMVGETIIVAPVLQEGATSRSVYLPTGKWEDGNNGTIYQGPIRFNYPAPIDVLPFFIKQT